MAEAEAQASIIIQRWKRNSARAGLYGELPPLPLPDTTLAPSRTNQALKSARAVRIFASGRGT